MQLLFFALIDISNQFNSVSHACNKFSKDVIVGAADYYGSGRSEITLYKMKTADTVCSSHK